MTLDQDFKNNHQNSQKQSKNREFNEINQSKPVKVNKSQVNWTEKMEKFNQLIKVKVKLMDFGEKN